MSAATDLVARSCTAQGICETVTDPAVLARVAALIASERGDAPAAGPGHRKDRRLAGSRRSLDASG
jgi:hypothetical protein